MSNKNSRVGTRVDRKGRVRTETLRRDVDSIAVSASTDVRNNSTSFYIDFPPGEEVKTVRLNGREARTLYTLLQRHYQVLGK